VDARLRRSARAWRAWRPITFAVGLVLVAAALSPPVEAAATGARGHMTQHLLLGMYAPLALVLGAPATLPLAALPVRAWPQCCGPGRCMPSPTRRPPRC
jgi:putative membrane protein